MGPWELLWLDVVEEGAAEVAAQKMVLSVRLVLILGLLGQGLSLSHSPPEAPAS